MKKSISGIMIIAMLYAGDACQAKEAMRGSKLELENPRIAVAIDSQNGAILSIRDKQQDVVYPQTGIGFEVVTTEGTLRSEKATAVKSRAGEAELSFTGNGLDVTLHYRLGAEDHFVEKWLEIKASDGNQYLLKSVMLEDVTTEAFSEIHFHDDQTIWHCPINLFLLGDKGGCFAGKYPTMPLPAQLNTAAGFGKRRSSTRQPSPGQALEDEGKGMRLSVLSPPHHPGHEPNACPLPVRK